MSFLSIEISRRFRTQLRDKRNIHYLRQSVVTTAMETVSIVSLKPPLQVTLICGLSVIVWLTYKLFKHLRERSLNIPLWSDGSHACHRWKLIAIITHTAYCNVCESLIVDGMYCECCGTCADFGCHKKADNMFNCKTLSMAKSDPRIQSKQISHLWICGNLLTHSTCDVCGDDCDDESALVDWKCCWCQRCVHLKCLTDELRHSDCDLGKWRTCIVPPFCVIHKKVWSKGRRKFVIESMTNFEDESNWKPLIIITNRKSGNNDGDKILTIFRTILNPLQVIDLNETSIESSVELCEILSKTNKEITFRILVAAGDGTIGWVLNTIQKLKINPMPLIGILPFGTGNDLSRVLGWGQSFSFETSIDEVMNKVLNTRPIDLDRWSVKLSSNRSLGIPLPSKHYLMNNYFSVGVDALVALNFHETRKSRVYNYLFTNRFVNKFLYLTYGTKDLLERKCKNLNEKIILELDGKRIDLPELESIIILNIMSWGGGVDIWNLGNGAVKQKINDKKLEVLGVYSTFHIGQLMIGLSEPLRFGQAKEVKLILLERLPIQVDGEPWLQFPTTITITWNSFAKMLTTRSELL
ncbi:diacylglycerol kinase epsilon-like [Oppia nitens]|uniref:diacylglycerol kinase epsilon-like n=1 Tax=Oppia nitens TaxID=1686743 RepID=UPI0023DC70DF|nr:diacylglycerol kinase epsilon-like [Oppia nitens]